MIIKEVCVESFEEAYRAVAAGASRIELCDNLAVGGTTPSLGTIQMCLRKLTVPVFVMIRPRGGNFVYSKDELEIMEEDIINCKKLGVKGVVLGILNEKMEIDFERTSYMVERSHPMEVTFHKAIDETEHLIANAILLKKLGVQRILSSGGKISALEGKEVLNQMILSGDQNLKIVVAGKVTHENFNEVQQLIPNGEYHGRRLVQFLTDMEVTKIKQSI